MKFVPILLSWSLIPFCIFLGAWWLSLYVLNFVLTRELADGGDESVLQDGLNTEFLTLKWVDITAFQFIVSAIVSLLLSKVLLKQWNPVAGKKTSLSTMYIASFCHLLAVLTTNAAYTIVPSDIGNLMTSCQPLFTCFFMTKTTSHSKISSILFIMVGAIMLQIRSTLLVTNSWGFVASTLTSLALAVRNITLKEGRVSWTNTLEKFVVVSCLGATIALPIWLLKFAVTGMVFTAQLVSGSVLALVVQPVQFFFSLKVLEIVSPVTHAIVNVCIQLYSTSESFVALSGTNFSSNIAYSFFVILLGLCLYYFSSQQNSASWLFIKLLALLAVLSYFFVLNPGYPLWRVEKKLCSYRGLAAANLRDRDLNMSISTAWLYDRDVNESVAMNIASLAENNPQLSVYVYCGTAQCVDEVTDLDFRNLVVGVATLSDLVKDTPLEKWVSNHQMNKLLTGLEFEKHLHEVAILGMLWQYGGYYVNPMIKLAAPLPIYQQNGNIAAASKKVTVSTASLPSLFDVAYFSRHHPVIQTLSSTYVTNYPTFASRKSFKFDFTEMVWNVLPPSLKRAVSTFDGVDYTKEEADSTLYHYGILSQSSKQASSSNTQLVEEMENIVGLQFLPFLSDVIDRSGVQSFDHTANSTAFLDGRWKASEDDLASLSPVMLSVALGTDTGSVSDSYLDLLRSHEPIGSFDFDTVEFLRANGVKMFWGSLMLMLKGSSFYTKEQQRIVVDLRRELAWLLPREVQDRAIVAVNSKGAMTSPRIAAYQLLLKFGSAKLVITENLHYALSCVALETPVIYINTANREVPDAINTLFHLVSLTNMTDDEATGWFRDFPWHSIPPNPDPALFMRLRATAWNVIRQNQHLHDTAVRFGVVPMSRPLSLQNQHRLVFHLIFSTSEESTLSIFYSLKRMSGKFNWRHLRSIESIFHHHPNAQVIIYSNTLSENTLNVLVEAGYSIKVQRYCLETMLRGTIAEGFIKKLSKARIGSFWYSHQTDLLRFFLLYTYGGIYMDTDIILVKPVDTLKMNTIAWEDDKMNLLNGAFAKFEKGNLFLETCLKELVKNYRADLWGQNCPKLLTRIYRGAVWSSNVVNVIDYRYFYMIPGFDMNAQCFFQTEGATFEENMKTLKSNAYVVHTNGKISGTIGIGGNSLKNGTICKHLLNSYCVLCDHVY